MGSERPEVGGTVIGDDSNKVTIFLYEETDGSGRRVQEEQLFRYRGSEEDGWERRGGEKRTMTIGRKGISVVGGTLDITAIDESCPAWVSCI